MTAASELELETDRHWASPILQLPVPYRPTYRRHPLSRSQRAPESQEFGSGTGRNHVLSFDFRACFPAKELSAPHQLQGNSAIQTKSRLRRQPHSIPGNHGTVDSLSCLSITATAARHCAESSSDSTLRTYLPSCANDRMFSGPSSDESVGSVRQFRQQQPLVQVGQRMET